MFPLNIKKRGNLEEIESIGIKVILYHKKTTWNANKLKSNLMRLHEMHENFQFYFILL